MSSNSWFAVIEGEVIRWDTLPPYLAVDPLVVNPVRLRLASGLPLALSPTGPFLEANMADPLAALAAVQEVYGRDAWTSPDAPTIDGIPADAVV